LQEKVEEGLRVDTEAKGRQGQESKENDLLRGKIARRNNCLAAKVTEKDTIETPKSINSSENSAGWSKDSEEKAMASKTGKNEEFTDEAAGQGESNIGQREKEEDHSEKRSEVSKATIVLQGANSISFVKDPDSKKESSRNKTVGDSLEKTPNKAFSGVWSKTKKDDVSVTNRRVSNNLLEVNLASGDEAGIKDASESKSWNKRGEVKGSFGEERKGETDEPISPKLQKENGQKNRANSWGFDVGFRKPNMEGEEGDLRGESEEKGDPKKTLVFEGEGKKRKCFVRCRSGLSVEVKQIKESENRTKEGIKGDSIGGTDTTFTRTPKKNKEVNWKKGSFKSQKERKEVKSQEGSQNTQLEEKEGQEGRQKTRGGGGKGQDAERKEKGCQQDKRVGDSVKAGERVKNKRRKEAAVVGVVKMSGREEVFGKGVMVKKRKKGEKEEGHSQKESVGVKGGRREERGGEQKSKNWESRKVKELGRGGIKEVPGRQGEELRIKEVNREERNSRKRRKDRRGGRSEHQTTNNREKRKGVLFMKKETWRSGPVSAMGERKKG
jgi:hypothetical protein